MSKKPEVWAIDDGVDSPENMSSEILAGVGTPREWVAVGKEDKDGYAESVAYCHPLTAPKIRAAPELITLVRKIQDAVTLPDELFAEAAQLLEQYYAQDLEAKKAHQKFTRQYNKTNKEKV